MPKKPPTVKQLKAKAWKLTSEYIRRKYANQDGLVSCVTCYKVFHWKEIQAGHYIPKARGNSIRYEETNIHPQCVSCNIFGRGKEIEYTRFMIDTYGQEEIIRLDDLRKQKKYWRRDELEQLIELRQEQLKSLPSS